MKRRVLYCKTKYSQGKLLTCCLSGSFVQLYGYADESKRTKRVLRKD